jgi:hypothetical protein
MAVRLVCRACGKRLKLPDGARQKRSAKCPKCLAPVDLTAALEASAYLPTIALSTPARDAQHRPPIEPREDDPLPYPAPQPAPKSPLAPPPVTPSLSKAAVSPAPPGSSSESASSSPASPARPPSTHPTPFPGEILSLDDEPTGPAAEPDPPFRVPVRVLADSLRQVVGPCCAVLVPHGLFLEHEPMKPFLYAPVGCAVGAPGAGGLALTLPDGRAVTLQFETRSARPLARDARAFLAGDRPVPVAADYRGAWWLLWAALIFALGLAGGPLVLAHAADLGPEFGLQVGAGFALLGLAGNAAVVFASRGSVPGQLAVMAGVCVAVTGLFLFGAAAYLAGRHRGAEEARADPPAAPVPPAPNPPPEPLAPDPSPPRPPTHLDRAKKSGSSALEDGPADVTALALAPDHNTLAIGHADGTTRLWPLDQATFDAVLPGPKAEGPVTRVQFDTKSRFVFAHSATGVVAAPRNPAPSVAKLPGFPIAVAPEPDAERIRFAAVRGNALQLRLIATAFVQHPKGRDNGYVLPGKGDEVPPTGLGKDPAKPAATFFAWTPGGKLMAGQPDGSILAWSGPLRPEAASRDHKAAVKAWAACPTTGDFATGDDQGHVGVWSAKGGKPALTSVLATPITGLSFNATGSRLVVTDTTGWLVIWDVSAAKAIHRVKRPAAIRAVAAGPTDDVVLLAVGKTVEVWWVSELVK